MNSTMNSNLKIIDKLLKKLNNSIDIKTHDFLSFQKIKSCLIYIEEICNTEMINQQIIYPVMKYELEENCAPEIFAQKNAISISDSIIISDIDEAVTYILKGYCGMVFENSKNILLLNVQNFQSRTISEPPTSTVLKGPREGFTESVQTNLMLLRKRLINPNFTIEEICVGKYSKTRVCVCYINGIADANLVKKVKDKISQINIDGVIDSYYIQNFIEDKGHSLFKQVGNTEKPDIAVAKMLEGRIVITINGSPVALTLPFIFLEDLQSANDYYYSRKMRVAFLRYLRLIGVIIAIFLPGIYVAIQNYHYKLVPLNSLITILNSTQGIPFSPLVEILFITILFEILYEASLRMPRYIGLGLSVVGALILGETAVNAGLVSPPAVMIVALTGVVLYTVPDQEAQMSMLRLIAILVGGVLGLYGIVICAIFILIFLCSLDSFGVSYLAPFAPLIRNDLQDATKKEELKNMKYRPESIPHKNDRRIGKQ